MRRFLAALAFCLMAALIQMTAVATGAPRPDLASNTWLLQDVDTDGSVGTYCSLDVDSAGDAHISYHASPGGLKYAKSTDTGWAIQVVDSGAYGSNTSLKVDACR